MISSQICSSQVTINEFKQNLEYMLMATLYIFEEPAEQIFRATTLSVQEVASTVVHIAVKQAILD